MDGDSIFDRASGRSVTRQLADLLRADVDTGRLAPGDPIPSEDQIAGQYQVDRTTARAAIALLRADGVIITQPGRGPVVAGTPQRQTVVLPVGAVAEVRMPTEAERHSGHGVRVIEVRHGDTVDVFDADLVRLEASSDGT